MFFFELCIVQQTFIIPTFIVLLFWIQLVKLVIIVIVIVDNKLLFVCKSFSDKFNY